MTDDGALKITFALTRHDIYRANASIAHKKRSWKRVLLSTLVFIASASYLFRFFMSRADPPIDWATAIFMGTILAVGLELVFWPLTLAVVRGFAYYSASSLVRSKPTVLQPITYEFSSSGVLSEGAAGSGRSNWSYYVRFRETSHQFLMYFQKHLAYAIPRKSFGSSVEIERFRQIVRENFPGPIEFAKRS